MRPFDLPPSILSRIAALFVVGVFALMAAGMLHGACTDGDGQPERTEHSVICECVCHLQLYVEDAKVVRVSVDLAPSHFIVEPTFRLPDSEPSGIFRPPKHLA